MAEHLVDVRHVSFAYDGRTVLSDVSFPIDKGDYIGIIGPNGGGKTTLLKLIIGLLHPREGQIHYGRDSSIGVSRSRVGYISQKAVNLAGSFPITVEEVVMMGRYVSCRIFQRISAKDKEIVNHSLSFVGIESLRDRCISDLSSGQQQRVFIARALASEPDILFLDEPTVGVDIKTQEEFYMLLRNLHKGKNITLVLVSHDIDVVANEVTKIAWINERLLYYGEPKTFIKDDYLTKLYGKHVSLLLHGHGV